MKREWVFVGVIAVALAAAGVTGCGDDGDTTPMDDAGSIGDGGNADGGNADGGPVPFAPTKYCPGPDCPDEAGTGQLQVGAAKQDVTPIVETSSGSGSYNYAWNGEPLESHVDLNGNGEYDPTEGETYEDLNDNGKLDGIWMAGFGNARDADKVHDQQWARAVALRNENTTIVFVAIDCVGYFKSEMDAIRDMVSDLDVDYVSISATHVHEAQDTLGIWGVNQGTTGLHPEYMQYLREKAAQAIRDAVAALQPATIQYASFHERDLTVPPDGSPDGIVRFNGDARDPNILDDEVRILRFQAMSDDSTISTLVNWASHPEYTGSHNRQLTSDFPGYLRDGVENGVPAPGGGTEPGIGGITVYISGALGGQIGPNRGMQLITFDGTPTTGTDLDLAHPRAMIAGQEMAYFILKALEPGGGSVTDMTAELGFKTREFYVPVQNTGYHVAFNLGLFDREVYNYDPLYPITADNTPEAFTEVAVLDIGRAELMTVPGELHPELFVGGYDGSNTPAGQDIIDPGNPNPPDLDAAPGAPYLRDLARSDAEYVFLLGLTEDMLGYLVPAYNYQLSDSAPYFDDAPGDHYEETNSVGVDGWPIMESQLRQLLAWEPSP